MFSFVSFRASVDEKPGGFGNSTFGVSIMRKISYRFHLVLAFVSNSRKSCLLCSVNDLAKATFREMLESGIASSVFPDDQHPRE